MLHFEKVGCLISSIKATVEKVLPKEVWERFKTFHFQVLNFFQKRAKILTSDAFESIEYQKISNWIPSHFAPESSGIKQELENDIKELWESIDTLSKWHESKEDGFSLTSDLNITLADAMGKGQKLSTSIPNALREKIPGDDVFHDFLINFTEINQLFDTPAQYIPLREKIFVTDRTKGTVMVETVPYIEELFEKSLKFSPHEEKRSA